MKTTIFAVALTLNLFCFLNVTHAQYGMGFEPNLQLASEMDGASLQTMGYADELPSSFSLKKYAPYPKNQGDFGTCVGWSSAYATMTINYAYQLGETDRNLITATAFCPYYVYNQIKSNPGLGCGGGSQMSNALLLFIEQGAKKFYMPTYGCEFPIDSVVRRDAANFRVKEAYYLASYPEDFVFDQNDLPSTISRLMATDRPCDIEGMKGAISEGSAVPMCMYLPVSFYSAGDLWEPTQMEKLSPGASVIDENGKVRGHAMTLVAYDDDKYGGAFQIMNSWGDSWGNGGYTWVRYDDFKQFVIEAYYLEMFPKSVPESGCQMGDCENGYARWKSEDGHFYEGDIKDGNPDGYGTYEWPSGLVYAGGWKEGKMHGKGAFFLADGTTGVVEYNNGEFVSGFDKVTYTDGAVYTGNFKNQEREGHGVYEFADGRVYDGGFENNVQNGMGMFVWTDNHYYIGEWSDGSQNGYGFSVQPDGQITAGKWEFGECVSASGMGFAGSDASKLAASLKEFGAAAEYTPYTMVGCYSGDCLNGEGAIDFPEGGKYIGDFMDGMMDGYGTLTLPDGLQVEGYWRQHKPAGIFKLTFDNGVSRIANMAADWSIQGYAMIYDQNGRYQVEYWENGEQKESAVSVNAINSDNSNRHLDAPELSSEKPVKLEVSLQ